MPSSLQGTSDYLLVSYMQSSVSKMINVLDEIQLLRGGADLMIALEEFRLAKGTYPAFLTELVPTYMASVPLDPWSGSMIGYKGVDASTDPFPVSYTHLTLPTNREV